MEVPEIEVAIDEILKHKDEHGIYQSMTNVPKHFGGTGEDVFSWCLCDAPSFARSAKRRIIMKNIKPGVDHLVSFMP